MILKEYRIRRGYTLEELAEKCDISWRNLQRIENGRDSKAQFGTIKKLINELKIDDKEIIRYIKQ
ncbi:MAG: helix-turn-helix transcriptional regulator [bacterium]|nr:helix-turn-helix transcriptional regulator [bacterium]